MSDMEDYGFEYSDDDYADEDVDIENQYYNSKGMLETDELQDALESFQQVLEMETEKGEWGFKALKQIVKLYYRLGNSKDMLLAYKNMLEYTTGTIVTRNAAEKKVNSILDFVSSQSTDPNLLQEFYSLTLEALAEAKNERLWFKTNVKLANLWMSLKQTDKAAKVLQELHQACQDTSSGADDSRKGTQLLEVYALQIQLHTAEKNTKQLKSIYTKALGIRSAIPHPRIMGIIRECGGKMHMEERAWEQAATDFFEAFKSYDEAGSPARSRCLKYLVLAYMLMESQVDPFDSQEARPYKRNPEVVAMTALVEAYQAGDIQAYQRVLRQYEDAILGDQFVSPYIEDLTRKIRTQVILKSTKPYSRIGLDFLAGIVGTDAATVEQLLSRLILDGKLSGKIDQINSRLILENAVDQEKKYIALEKWSEQLMKLQETVSLQLAG